MAQKKIRERRDNVVILIVIYIFIACPYAFENLGDSGARRGTEGIPDPATKKNHSGAKKNSFHRWLRQRLTLPKSKLVCCVPAKHSHPECPLLLYPRGPTHTLISGGLKPIRCGVRSPCAALFEESFTLMGVPSLAQVFVK